MGRCACGKGRAEWSGSRECDMNHHQGFLQAIIESPDDDTPRLVFADWLDDHDQPQRAEFIRVQIERARLSEDDAKQSELRERENSLLETCREAWLEPIPACMREFARFRRGFVERV